MLTDAIFTVTHKGWGPGTSCCCSGVQEPVRGAGTSRLDVKRPVPEMPGRAPGTSVPSASLKMEYLTVLADKSGHHSAYMTVMSYVRLQSYNLKTPLAIKCLVEFKMTTP